MKRASAWKFQHSVDVNVPKSFAWKYMTDVSNWNDPPAEFSLEGPFAKGTRGWTRMPGQAPNSWLLKDVKAGRGYTIGGGSFLEKAELLVHWQFEAVSKKKTRLTQRLELLGENAAHYSEEIKAAFEPNLAPGMQRIADQMTSAASKPSGRGAACAIAWSRESTVRSR